MALRLVEAVVPADRAETLSRLVVDHARGGPWTQTLDDKQSSVRFLLDADDAGEVVDEIQRDFGGAEGFHLVIIPVTAALPRPPERERDDGEPARRTFGSKGGGLTREELRAEAVGLARPTRVFYVTVMLSTIVVGIGLLKGSAAVIIGAMVIAPLLGPNVALALATTLGDVKLMRRSLASNVSGVSLALVLSILVGALFDEGPLGREVMSRTDVGISDITLALAAGSAGALAMTTGVASALVGVMVAVALLPPIAVVGIMIARGEDALAGHALLLLLVNVIGVNLAATATFLIQGIRPRAWWQADRARRATLIALGIGVTLVVALAVFFWLGKRPG